MPITPYLYYEDVASAMKFLAKAFGFRRFGAVSRGPDRKINHAAMKAGSSVVLMGRPPAAYRSCHLVERPCPDWADALVRHWLYEIAEDLRWEALATSSEPSVAAVVARARREEAYHRRHADALAERVLVPVVPVVAGRARAR